MWSLLSSCSFGARFGFSVAQSGGDRAVAIGGSFLTSVGAQPLKDVLVIAAASAGWTYRSGFIHPASFTEDGRFILSHSSGLIGCSFFNLLIDVDSPTRSLYLLNGLTTVSADLPLSMMKSSDDGATWSVVAQSNFYTSRYAAGASLMQTEGVMRLVVCGGRSLATDAFLADCYESSDEDSPLGTVWIEQTASGEFGPVAHHSFFNLHQSLISVAGMDQHGDATNQVWTSRDGGRKWTLLCEAPFAARYYHAAALQSTLTAQPNSVQGNPSTFHSVLLLTGGWSSQSSVALNDVWLSVDGAATWQLATSNAAWVARQGHALVATGGAWYITGGQSGAQTGQEEMNLQDSQTTHSTAHTTTTKD